MSGSDVESLPDPFGDREDAQRVAERLRERGAFVATTAAEEMDIAVGTMYNILEDLESEGLVTRVKDPRQPRRKVWVPHFGKHAKTPEEWLAEVVYGDR